MATKSENNMASVINNYQELMCEFIGNKSSCDIQPMVKQAYGGNHIVTVNVNEFREQAQEFHLLLAERGIVSDLVMNGGDAAGELSLVAFLDETSNAPIHHARKNILKK